MCHLHLFLIKNKPYLKLHKCIKVFPSKTQHSNRIRTLDDHFTMPPGPNYYLIFEYHFPYQLDC
jgi:hypothetical protein